MNSPLIYSTCKIHTIYVRTSVYIKGQCVSQDGRQSSSLKKELLCTMGNPTAFSSTSLHFFSLALATLVMFSFFNDGDAAADRKLMATESHEFHIIKLSSILPDSVCDSSSQGSFSSFP